MGAYYVQFVGAPRPDGFRPLQLVNGMAVNASISSALNGDRSLYFIVHTDPRVLFTGVSKSMRVDRVVDQNWRSVIVPPPAEALTTVPKIMISHFTVTTPLNVAGVLDIHEVHGVVPADLLTEKQSVKIDLANWEKPVETPAGKLTFTRNENGGFSMTIVADKNAGAAAISPEKPLEIRTFGERGQQLVKSGLTSVPLNVPLPAPSTGGKPAAVELTFAIRTARVELPFAIAIRKNEGPPAPAAP
jgi:hypothetical protein